MISGAALAFIIKAFGMGVSAFRFLTAFRGNIGLASGGRIGALLAIIYLCNGLIHAMFGMTVFLFPENVWVWSLIFLISHFFLITAAVAGMYLALYILFPMVPRWPAVLGVLLSGISLIAWTVILNPQPILSASGDIDWGLPYWLGINLAFLIFLNIGGPLLVFSAAFLRSGSHEVKFISLVVLTSACFGIIANFVRFVLPGATTSVVPRMLDAGVGILLLSVFVPSAMVMNLGARMRRYFEVAQKREVF